MKQLTVNDLKRFVDKQVEKGNGNKYIIISNDVEGNGYHGLWYSFLDSKEHIVEAITTSNGISDSVVEDSDKLVILG